MFLVTVRQANGWYPDLSIGCHNLLLSLRQMPELFRSLATNAFFHTPYDSCYSMLNSLINDRIVLNKLLSD